MKFKKILLTGALLVSTFTGTTAFASADTNPTGEWGQQYVMLGWSLTPEERLQTMQALEVKGASSDMTVGNSYDVKTTILDDAGKVVQENGSDKIIETKVKLEEVNGTDLVKYLGSTDFNSQSGAWSSAKVAKGDAGSGVVVKITTPDNITAKTKETYANAAITAGASDIAITVASVKPIDGSGALTGVYKALEEQGYTINQQQVDAGQKELSVVSEIVNDNDQVDNKKLNVAVADAKQQIGEEKQKTKEPLTKEQIDSIVTNALELQGIDSAVTPEQKEKLVDLLQTVQDSGALDSKEALEQLSKYKDEVMENAKNIFKDIQDSEQAQGFFAKVSQFFKGIGEWITGLF